MPIWSGSITGLQGLPVGGEHGTIYKNTDLRRTMAILLGCEGVLAAAPEYIEVSVRDRVAEPEDVVHVALTFSSPVTELDRRAPARARSHG